MTYMWLKRLARLMMLALIPLLLAGCARNIPESNFCVIYQPVYSAYNDTEETKKQVDANNLAYDCLCEHDIDTCERAGF